MTEGQVVDPTGLRTKTATTTVSLPENHVLHDNALVRQARHVDPPAAALPPGVGCIRRATIADARAIAEILESYQLTKISARDHPKNGWLVQMATADQIVVMMEGYKLFFVAEALDEKVIAFQAVSTPRMISRPPSKHKFFSGANGRRAFAVLKERRFIYMSQVAVHLLHRDKKGLAAALQADVLRQLEPLPLVAHVAVFTQADYDAWDRSQPFDPISNNVASHKYHQKHGYVLGGWTGNLAGSIAFNTGLPSTDPTKGVPGIVGVVYVNYRDGREDIPYTYVDPVQAVLAHPCMPGEANSDEWENAFIDYKKALSIGDIGDEGFLSHMTWVYEYNAIRAALQSELDTIVL
jgi:hypothetical protein